MKSPPRHSETECVKRHAFGFGITLERRLADLSSSIASEKPVPAIN